jgi:hypothetical protein
MPPAPEPALSYGREGTAGPTAPPAQRMVVDRFEDGGVTVWARAKSWRGAFAAQAAVTLVLAVLLMTAITNGRPWLFAWALARMGWPALAVLGIVGAWLTILYRAWRREKRGERGWDVLGIGPDTVYVDVEARKGVRGGKFEVPRADLHDVRLTHWSGKGSWAKSVEIITQGHEPVDLCWGFREAEIHEAHAALSQCLHPDAIATPTKRGRPVES